MLMPTFAAEAWKRLAMMTLLTARLKRAKALPPVVLVVGTAAYMHRNTTRRLMVSRLSPELFIVYIRHLT